MPNLPLQRLYIHSPAVAMAARVNLATAVYPLTTLPFDGVSAGAYTAVAPDMWLALGTAAGLDDLGRVRVVKPATATYIPIGRVSQGIEDGTLDALDNAYITVYADYRIHSKLPYITPTTPPVTYKDANEPVGTWMDEPPPVCNVGEGVGDTIDPITGKIEVRFDAGTSFAVADGATIATYAWDLQGGVVISGSLAAAVVVATFTAGFRWISCTATDSNGRQHTARAPIMARDPANDLCVPFQVPQRTLSLNGGQRVVFKILEDLPRATYPDGTLVMWWNDGRVSNADRTNIQFIGWEQSNTASVRADELSLTRSTTLECVDVGGRLMTLPGFAQTVEKPDDGAAAAWDKMPAPNADKYIHYLLQWHSTALGLADYFPSGTGDTYPFVIFQSAGSNLYEQVNRMAQSICPDHALTINRRGQMSVIVDQMLQDLVDRSSVTQGTFSETYWNDLRFSYTRPPKVHTLRASALLTATDWTIVEGKKTLATAFAIAPGTTPSQGTVENVDGEQLAQSQAQLNAVTGHAYARRNARHGMITLSVPLGDVDDLDPATLDWVGLVVTSATAAQRGMAFEVTRCQLKEVNVSYQYSEEATTASASVTLEVETWGKPALTEVTETPLPVGTTPAPPAPPSFGLIGGVELVAGLDLDGNVYTTSDFQTPSGSGGPTWTPTATGITETLYTWVVDPFSPGYIAGAGAINGWVATEDAIYKLNDLFGTLSVDEVHTFAVSADAASFHWRTIQASFGAFFGGDLNPWLICISYYGDTSGHEGTWSTFSVDGGATWATEVQVSPYYAALAPTRLLPIGLYASPKTPGLAYTAAYLASAGALPRWSIWDDEAGVYTDTGLGATATVTSVSAAGPLVDQFLTIAPPPNTKRMVITGTWSSTYSSPSGGACASVVQVLDDNLTDLTDDLTHSGPVPDTSDGTTTGSFTAEFTFPTFASADWPYNTSNYASAGMGNASRVRAYSDTTGAAICTTTVTITVDEIELDDGTIYAPANQATDGFVSTNWGASWIAATVPAIQPGSAMAGTLHLPWENNASEQLALYGSYEATTVREFRLHSANGASVSDSSPDDGAINYGPNRPHFGVRAYDSDRQFLLLAGMGNDTSLDPDDDKHAVFVSDDYGATWAEVVAPIADSGAPTNRPAFEAAFAGDNEQILFLWGPPTTIAYSADFGATVDDRSGDLPTTEGFVGIAGGPTP